ncbi:CD63 antigen [Episyrphus balteatus]|uniref:CD63 antigen n=1 Tax=Episyrphus balteatus TaxID=286459 RepID=UPI002486619E|nr:CD63 antigen [Episyrphus balteatus]
MTITDAYRLNSSMKCAKYMLLIISFMFAITAILLILVGETIQTIFGDFRQFLDDYYLSPPTLLIATGFLMFAVAILGSYGAIKESVLIINLYGVSLFVVFILEVAAAIAAFVLQSDVHVMLVRTMNESMHQYESNLYLQNGVDFMQSGLQCCGIYGPMDWKPVLEDNINNNLTNDIYVPPSCCYEPVSINDCSEKYESGCLGRMHFIISQSAMLIATGASTVAFVQLLGSICAFMLAKTLRRNKSIREARRWQLQQTLGALIASSKPMPIPSQEGYQQLGEKEKYMEEYHANSPSVN